MFSCFVWITESERRNCTFISSVHTNEHSHMWRRTHIWLLILLTYLLISVKLYIQTTNFLHTILYILFIYLNKQKLNSLSHTFVPIFMCVKKICKTLDVSTRRLLYMYYSTIYVYLYVHVLYLTIYRFSPNCMALLSFPKKCENAFTMYWYWPSAPITRNDKALKTLTRMKTVYVLKLGFELHTNMALINMNYTYGV